MLHLQFFKIIQHVENYFHKIIHKFKFHEIQTGFAHRQQNYVISLQHSRSGQPDRTGISEEIRTNCHV